MRRLAALALIIFWPLLAQAADWQVVADTTLGVLRMDKASVTREGTYTLAKLAYEFKKQQRFTSPPKDVFNKREDDVLVDCSNPSLGLQTSRFYDDGKLVNTFTEKRDNIKFNSATPDTMTKTVVDTVCAAMSASKP